MQQLDLPTMANTDNLRKRVAVAICTACDERPFQIGDARGNEFRWQDYLGAADAAIQAVALYMNNGGL